MRKGFRGDYLNRPAGTALPENRLSYLALPLLLVGRLSDTFSFQLGPQAALLLGVHTDGQALDLAHSGYRRLELGTGWCQPTWGCALITA